MAVGVGAGDRERHEGRTVGWAVGRGVLGVAGVVVLALACGGGGGGGGGGTGPDVTEGEIEVTVRADDAGVSGVEVAVFEAGGSAALVTGQTGSSGTALFEGLEAGGYEVEVSVPDGYELAGGESARQSVTVTAGSRAQVGVDLELAGEVVEVRMTSGRRFEPSSVTIAPGTTVRWINDSSMAHTVTPDGHSEWSRGTVSSQGETFSHTFSGTGTFPYFCEPHQSAGMTGSVTVQ